jgi:hypothetical protein
MLKKVMPLVVGLVLGLILGSLGVTGASASIPANTATAHAVPMPTGRNANVTISITPNSIGDGYSLSMYRFSGTSWVPCAAACRQVHMHRQGNTFVITLPRLWNIVGSSYVYSQTTKTGVIQTYACGMKTNRIPASVPNGINPVVFTSIPLVSATLAVHRPGRVPPYDVAACSGGMK